MGQLRILVIEDDGPIRRGIVDALRFHGYEPLAAADGETGLRCATQEEYDLLLLDLVLPGPDGLEILKAVRHCAPARPVIILTARGEEQDRVRGLSLGADDYIVKPFSIRELLARVEAVLRRSPERPQPAATLRIPGATVDLVRGRVEFSDGTSLELSERETELLRYFADRAGQIIPRSELLARVWHMNPSGLETRSVDMTIARLREKLRDSADTPRLIRTLRGKGYQFDKEASP